MPALAPVMATTVSVSGRVSAGMAETLLGSSCKTDVESRAKDSVNQKVDSVKSKVTGANDSLLGTVSDKAGSVGNSVSAAAGTVSDRASGAAGTVSDATPIAQDVRQAARRGRSLAQENPLFVTPKTVEAHLTRAYGKLGVRRREDLGAALDAPRLEAAARWSD
jgi:hypothetical protein